jgi:hypothetical protein
VKTIVIHNYRASFTTEVLALTMTNNDDNDDDNHATVETTPQKNNVTSSCIDQELQQARQELQALRDHREKERQQWQQEVSEQSRKLELVNLALHHNLEKRPIAFYMTHLKQSYAVEADLDDVPPVYVLKQQSSLMMATHSSFAILPKQFKLLEQHRDEISNYLHAELAQLHQEHDEATQRSLQRVSQVAQENHTCYDAYQDQLDKLTKEIRSLWHPSKEIKDDDTERTYDEEEDSLQSSFSKFPDFVKNTVVSFAVERISNIPVG